MLLKCDMYKRERKINSIQSLCTHVGALSSHIMSLNPRISLLYVLPSHTHSVVQSSSTNINASRIWRIRNRGIVSVDLVNALVAIWTGRETEAVPGQLARSTGLSLRCVRKARDGGSLRNGSRMGDGEAELAISGYIDLLAAWNDVVHTETSTGCAIGEGCRVGVRGAGDGLRAVG